MLHKSWLPYPISTHEIEAEEVDQHYMESRTFLSSTSRKESYRFE